MQRFAPAAEYTPNPQLEQDPDPAAEYMPAAQAPVQPAVVRPVVAPYVPAGQLVHAFSAPLDEY